MDKDYKVGPTVSIVRTGEPKILNQFRERCKADWEEIQNKIPDKLYHYTSAEGFLGIASTKTLWFTHIKYFQDRSEGEYGRNLVLNIIDNLFKKDIKEREKEFLNMLKDHYENDWQVFNNDIYVASLCDQKDVLSQWERFGNKGYCLGFKLTKETLLGYTTGNSNRAVIAEANQVIYKKDIQTSLIKELMKDLMKLLKDNKKVRVSDCLEIMMNQVEYWLFNFKDQFFKEENEWRLMVNLQGFAHDSTKDIYSLVSFRTKEGTIIPYIPLRVINEDFNHESKFPMTEIIIGPTLNKYGIDSIRFLVKKFQLPDTKIGRSVIPIR